MNKRNSNEQHTTNDSADAKQANTPTADLCFISLWKDEDLFANIASFLTGRDFSTCLLVTKELGNRQPAIRGLVARALETLKKIQAPESMKQLLQERSNDAID